jgi:hypothetical protein
MSITAPIPPPASGMWQTPLNFLQNLPSKPNRRESVYNTQPTLKTIKPPPPSRQNVVTTPESEQTRIASPTSERNHSPEFERVLVSSPLLSLPLNQEEESTTPPETEELALSIIETQQENENLKELDEENRKIEPVLNISPSMFTIITTTEQTLEHELLKITTPIVAESSETLFDLKGVAQPSEHEVIIITTPPPMLEIQSKIADSIVEHECDLIEIIDTPPFLSPTPSVVERLPSPLSFELEIQGDFFNLL